MTVTQTAAGWWTPPTTIPNPISRLSATSEKTSAVNTFASMNTSGGSGLARNSRSTFMPRSLATPIPKP